MVYVAAFNSPYWRLFMQAIFLDLETSGLDPFRHRILEIAFKIIDLSSGKEEGSYYAVVKQPFVVWEEADPNSLNVNGFTWEKIQTGKEENVVRQEILDLFSQFGVHRQEFVYLCQNPAFDRNFFAQLIDVYTQEEREWPYHWLDFASMYWAIEVKELQCHRLSFPSKLKLSKNAIAQRYQLPSETFPHSALNGVNHLLLCYQTVVGFEKKS